MTKPTRRILCIDDEGDVLRILKTTLETEGYMVETASSSKEGLELAVVNPPDLLIIDLMMPEMNGEELTKKLRDHPSTQTIPIIMLTGVGDKKMSRKALLELDIEYYIVKPWDHEDLTDKVHQAIRYRRKP